ncbi:MAG: cupin domain-containing protein [Oscillospiraceae bacterium]|nr:cupin domain-containing protein [Oscillospiraceae bacterium]
MICKAEAQRRSQEPHLKGGKDTVRLIHFLEETQSYGTGRLFGISIIPPGGSIGYHTHTGDFEVYYILKGTAKVVDNGVEDILHPGDSMICREGDSHSIENIGDRDLEYVAIILYTNRKGE